MIPSAEPSDRENEPKAATLTVSTGFSKELKFSFGNEIVDALLDLGLFNFSV